MRILLQKLSERISLTTDEAQEALDYILNDEVSESEIAAFLIGLKTKGETVEEITGTVKAIRKNTLPFKRNFKSVLDNCGTGGDGSSSFNISTTAAFVIAGAGITVAKHGNRSISSKTGSADVLRYLGVDFELEPERIEYNLEEHGIAFLFAPHVHPKLMKVMKVRRELKIPTIFNLIGPLTNPIQLDYQVLGIYRRDLLDVFTDVLDSLGRKRAIILNGAGYMDEASLQGDNHLNILEDGNKSKFLLNPSLYGLMSASNQDIRGGDSIDNARILEAVLKGEKGAYRDTVLLNAGLGIFAARKANSISEGIEIAKESIDTGAALEKLHRLVESSKTLKKGAI